MWISSSGKILVRVLDVLISKVEVVLDGQSLRTVSSSYTLNYECPGIKIWT